MTRSRTRAGIRPYEQTHGCVSGFLTRGEVFAVLCVLGLWAVATLIVFGCSVR
jgi:hypothetical protein